MSEKPKVVPIRPLGVEVSSATARRSATKLNAWISAAISRALSRSPS